MPARSPSRSPSPSRNYSGRTRSPYSPARSRRSAYTNNHYYSDSFHSDDDDRPRRGGRAYSRSPSIRTYNKRTTRASPAVKRGGVAKRGGKKPGASTPRLQNDFVSKRVLSARRLKINELKNEIETLSQELDGIKGENKTLRRDNILQTRQLERLQDTEGELPQLIDRHNKETRVLKEQIRKYKEKNDKLNHTLRDVENELGKSQRKLKKLQGISDDNRLEERDTLSRRLGKAELDVEEKNKRIEQLERHIENLERNHRREHALDARKYAELQAEMRSMEEDFEYTKNALREKAKELDIKNIYTNSIALARHRGSVASLPALEHKYTPINETPEPTPREKAKQYEVRRREEKLHKKSELSRLNNRSPSSISPHALPSIPNSADKERAKQKPRDKSQPQQTPAKIIPNKVSPRKEAVKPPAYENSTPPRKPTPRREKSPETVLEREDSWALIMKAQEKISNTKNNHTSKDSLDGSYSNMKYEQSSREQTFTVLAIESSKPAARGRGKQAKGQSSFFTTEVPEESLDSGGLDEQQRQRKQEELESLEREQRQREEQARREEKARRDAEDEERARRDKRLRREREREEREMIEKRERDERERKAREERERFEREERRRAQEEEERREAEVARRRKQEELDRIERQSPEILEETPEEAAERSRIAQDNQRRLLETDARAAEERRRKDLLLQKMKEIDTGSTNSKPSGGGDFFLTNPDSSESSRKDYNFRQADDNLHKGFSAQRDIKPARSRNIFGDDPKKDNPLFGDKKGPSIFNDDSDDLGFGGYQPSSYGSKASVKPAASKPFDNTWKPTDNQAGSKKNLMNDLFGNQSPTKSTSFGDDIFSSATKAKPVVSDKSGYPWEDEIKTRGASDKMLPRRPKADSSTIHNKPTVKAIDDFDDDIEELTL